ncbi:MAG: glycosyltransferase family 4 protein [Clostridia bacterium]|nr:glycosyltransferase family 4 protein [Clostridia bacterium]
MHKICHVTCVHNSLDIRIFIKECVSLAKAGFDVYLVAPGKSFEKDGVHVIGCGDAPTSRIKRATDFSKKIYEKAISLDADLYHFHDPELLRYAKKVSKLGKFSIFDSHEDIPAQILDKPWLPKYISPLVSKLFKIYETYCVKNLTAVVTATEFIENKFKGRTQKTITIRNYPKIDDILFHENNFNQRSKIACYAGGISKIRGEEVMNEAFKLIPDYELFLAGTPENNTYKDKAPENVKYLGQLNREQINELYSKARVGLCILLPTKNYVNALPIKLFEYMAAGLPVIASDFPLWKEIIDENNCGLVVDVEDREEISKKIKYLIDNPEYACQLGRNGRENVVKKYDWKVEAKRLVEFYKSLFN